MRRERDPFWTGRTGRLVPSILSLVFAFPFSLGCAEHPPKDAVIVKISFGSEKKGFLTDAIKAFHTTHPKTRSGRPI